MPDLLASPAVAAVVCGVGSFLPPTAVTSAEIGERLGVTDEWIRTRTGIGCRHRVGSGTATSDLAVRAGTAALTSAGVETVDVVVLATSTPDQHCPATAPTVAHGLGLTAVAALDVGAVCSGFVYALATGAGLLAAGVAERALVIGADTFSTIVHPDDRDSGPLFGDGAGAVVLRRGTLAEPGALLGFDLGSDGGSADLVGIRAGGSRRPRPQVRWDGSADAGDQVGDEAGDRAVARAPVADPERDHWFAMAGRAVYRQAVRHLSGSCRRVLNAVGWTPAEVDHFVLHQANRRILQAVARELDVDPQRLPSNIDRVANTAAASIPLLLAEAAQAGRLRVGERVVVSAFGGGLAWGSTALFWPAL